MKKILILNFSPRKKGNCAALAQLMAEDIKAKGCEAVVYNEPDMNYKGCKGCGACKKKDVPFCAQKDDFFDLLPLLDECDGIAFLAPVYFGNIPGPAKSFIDRLYCFFNPALDKPLFTPKESKKMAVIFTCGGGSGYENAANWVGGCFQTCGVTESVSFVQNGLNDLWNEENEAGKAAAAKAKEMADYLIK